MTYKPIFHTSNFLLDISLFMYIKKLLNLEKKISIKKTLFGICFFKNDAFSVFANLLLALFLWSALKKKLLPACLFLALATYQSFYPVMLLVPLCLMLLPEVQNTIEWYSRDRGRVKITN